MMLTYIPALKSGAKKKMWAHLRRGACLTVVVRVSRSWCVSHGRGACLTVVVRVSRTTIKTYNQC